LELSVQFCGQFKLSEKSSELRNIRVKNQDPVIIHHASLGTVSVVNIEDTGLLCGENTSDCDGSA